MDLRVFMKVTQVWDAQLWNMTSPVIIQQDTSVKSNVKSSCRHDVAAFLKNKQTKPMNFFSSYQHAKKISVLNHL